MLQPKMCHGHPGRVLWHCIIAESVSQINGGHGPPYECETGTADTAVARQWCRVATSVLSTGQPMVETMLKSEDGCKHATHNLITNP